MINPMGLPVDKVKYVVCTNICILSMQALFVMETLYTQDNIDYDPFWIIFWFYSNTEKLPPSLN